jgi:hypothetical protein
LTVADHRVNGDQIHGLGDALRTFREKWLM